jgi:hypothetical protein
MQQVWVAATRKRVLLLATTTGYQTRMFADAAKRLGVDLVYATDRCDQIDDPWQDGALAVRYHQEWRSVDNVLSALAATPVDGILAVGDRPVVLAALLARELGLPGHSRTAAAASRDKRLMRARLRAAGLPTPESLSLPLHADAAQFADRLQFPVVVKPTVLSGSRGFIRADDALAFAGAFARVRSLLEGPDVRATRDPEADIIQVERYIDGVEFALEGVMEHGRLHTLAIFDKPNPLEGPFFEETIYVTPSRARERAADVEAAVAAAAHAMGLHHGPVHAECRVTGAGAVFVLEVAARPIGGLFAKALRFEAPGQGSVGLEELLLRHALGESVAAWSREAAASGVMMIPIPRGGTYRRVSGETDARAVGGIEDIVVTAKPDQLLTPLPEGASYLGFIFARGATADAVEISLREAHANLLFTIDPPLPVVQHS